MTRKRLLPTLALLAALLAVLAAEMAAVAVPTAARGARTDESIRALRAARNGAIKARTAAINQLKGLLVTAPASVREGWGPSPRPRWLPPAPGSARTRPPWPIQSTPPRRRCAWSLAASSSWTRRSVWPINGWASWSAAPHPGC